MNSQISKSVHWVMLDNEGHGNPEYGQIETWNCGEHGHESEQSAKDCIQKKEDEKESYFLSLNCEPKKKQQIVYKEYWCCGHPDHKHPTKSYAKNCIIEGKNKLKVFSSNEKRTRKEIGAMCLGVLLGQTFSAAGKDLGVSAHRAKQIFDQTKRIVTKPKYDTQNDSASKIMDIDKITELRQTKWAVECLKQRIYRWECAEK